MESLVNIEGEDYNSLNVGENDDMIDKSPLAESSINEESDDLSDRDVPENAW